MRIARGKERIGEAGYFFRGEGGTLSETLHNFPGEISYHPLGESGPDHDKTFSVEVWIGEQCMGQGSGRTKKAAEQMAAYRAICRLKAAENKKQ